MSSSFFLSSPPSPHPAPLPLSSSSSLTRCPELDLSITLSSTHKPSPLKIGKQSPLKPCPQGQTEIGVNIQGCFEELVDVTVTPEQSRATPSKQPIRGQRRSRGCQLAPRQWMESCGPVSIEDPGSLSVVGLNTTRALKAELQSLQGSEFNSQKAIQETLRRSERTKTLINTRATEEVNVSRSQQLFSSLVSVEVQEDQLISQVLQHRLLPPCNCNKAADGPSLLLFKTSDHLRQKPVPLEEEPVSYKPCPLPCPPFSIFDLHRRGRC
ncbi:protein phosphatase 1 regulatory subunit 35 isoform X1 [Anoplopoma fimbria]|uniref:protein phosphatase 1 regulatory subunit 35 isoform X1 n=1 Tax=Anoplopoma fimbria TaxID=229290 RepID=UPI0023EC46BB|nr:protein phosphatase 1 regulatory subunit 35 isoform X1 [Anoplopoma fimbria]